MDERLRVAGARPISRKQSNQARKKDWNDRFWLEHIPDYTSMLDQHCESYRTNVLKSRARNLFKKPSAGTPPDSRERTPLSRGINSSMGMESFQQLKDEIEVLWREKQIPEDQQNLFRDCVFSLPKAKAAGVLAREIEDLKSNTSLVQHALYSIATREQSLATLTEMNEYMSKCEDLDTLRELQQECAELLHAHRILTLAVVESVVKWREQMVYALLMNCSEQALRKARTVPFMWHGVNYLLKLKDDVSFLGNSAFAYLFNFSERSDPFLIFTGTYDDSNYVKKSPKKTKQTLVLLPGGKVLVPVPPALVKRIRLAEMVILEEAVNHTDIQINYSEAPSLLLHKPPDKPSTMSPQLKQIVEDVQGEIIGEVMEFLLPRLTVEVWNEKVQEARPRWTREIFEDLVSESVRRVVTSEVQEVRESQRQNVVVTVAQEVLASMLSVGTTAHLQSLVTDALDSVRKEENDLFSPIFSEYILDIVTREVALDVQSTTISQDVQDTLLTEVLRNTVEEAVKETAQEISLNMLELQRKQQETERLRSEEEKSRREELERIKNELSARKKTEDEEKRRLEEQKLQEEAEKQKLLSQKKAEELKMKHEMEEKRLLDARKTREIEEKKLEEAKNREIEENKQKLAEMEELRRKNQLEEEKKQLEIAGNQKLIEENAKKLKEIEENARIKEEERKKMEEIEENKRQKEAEEAEKQRKIEENARIKAEEMKKLQELEETKRQKEGEETERRRKMQEEEQKQRETTAEALNRVASALEEAACSHSVPELVSESISEVQMERQTLVSQVSDDLVALSVSRLLPQIAAMELNAELGKTLIPELVERIVEENVGREDWHSLAQMCVNAVNLEKLEELEALEMETKRKKDQGNQSNAEVAKAVFDSLLQEWTSEEWVSGLVRAVLDNETALTKKVTEAHPDSPELPIDYGAENFTPRVHSPVAYTPQAETPVPEAEFIPTPSSSRSEMVSYDLQFAEKDVQQRVADDPKAEVVLDPSMIYEPDIPGILEHYYKLLPKEVISTLETPSQLLTSMRRGIDARWFWLKHNSQIIGLVGCHVDPLSRDARRVTCHHLSSLSPALYSKAIEVATREIFESDPCVEVRVALATDPNTEIDAGIKAIYSRLGFKWKAVATNWSANIKTSIMGKTRPGPAPTPPHPINMVVSGHCEVTTSSTEPRLSPAPTLEMAQIGNKICLLQVLSSLLSGQEEPVTPRGQNRLQSDLAELLEIVQSTALSRFPHMRLVETEAGRTRSELNVSIRWPASETRVMKTKNGEFEAVRFVSVSSKQEEIFSGTMLDRSQVYIVNTDDRNLSGFFLVAKDLCEELQAEMRHLHADLFSKVENMFRVRNM